MKMTKEVLVCLGYKKGEEEEDNFNGHPKKGYFYKSFIGEDGQVWITMDSPIGMKGMVFDNMAGTSNKGSIYKFVPLSKKSIIYTIPESINYNDMSESVSWLETDDDFEKLGAREEEIEFEEETVLEMPLELMMKSPGVMDAYTNSLLRYLRHLDKDIYSGVVYCMEQINSASLTGLKTPRLKSQLIDDIKRLLDRTSEESLEEEEVDSLVASFFILMKQLKDK